MSRRCWEQAARRHYRDAQYLLTQTPPGVENADHLFGVCADSVMNILGQLAAERQGQRLAEPEKVHINGKWSELASLRASRSLLSGHLQELPRDNPFKDWAVNQRYHCDGQVRADALDRHQKAAQKMLAALDVLKEAGVLS
jgi:hypothetical protein